MKNLKLLSIILFSVFIFSCKKETKNVTETVPVLVTPSNTDVGSITDSTATINASVSSEGGATITAKGVCWSTSHNPTIADHKTTNRQGGGNTVTNKTDNGEGISNFTAILTGLSAHTTYYIRVYATNSLGTGYSNEITVITTGNATTSCTDIDGNVYQTVTIGTQVWMAENLKTTRYNDGSAIATGLSDSAWGATTTGAYSFYNDSAIYNTTYGKLYNWYAVNTGKLAPAGWHVPTDAEWTTLTDYLGGESIAGDKMKSTSSLWTPYTGIVNTNSSGFSGLPGSYRTTNGTYSAIGGLGSWWSSTESSTSYAWFRYLGYYGSLAGRDDDYKTNGFSVRCLRD